MGWELVQDGERARCWLNLDEIEIYTEGTYKGRRNWKDSVGKKIGTRYQWKNDEVEEKWFVIKECVNCCLTLVDENNNEFKTHTDNLYKGRLGKIFDKKTDKFRYNIGDTVNDLVIINREYRKGKKNKNIKCYQYQCIKCDNVDWIVEGDLKKGGGCNVCCLTPRKVIKGVNDIATTNPEMCKYFVNQEDIYTHTSNSSERVLLKCPDCGFQKEKTINALYCKGFGCKKCGDGTSYPEKFMANVLIQLNIKFETQLSKTTFKWCDTYFYDFYLSDYNMIIETHGIQHYEDTGRTKYKNVHENDMLKYELARLNGFEMNKNYFVIDSRKSTLEWMKENIIKELGHLFDLSNVDWERADKESQHSHMILACQFKRENQKLTTKEIIELIKKETGIKHSASTITHWLNQGNNLGLCYYNGKEEKTEANKKNTGKNHPMYGKGYLISGEKHPRARKVVSVDVLTKQPVFTWQYVKQATEFYGIGGTALNSYLKGKRKSGHEYNGFLWYYLDEYEQLTN